MQHRDALDARAFAGQRVGDFHLPAARLRPALIHAQQHVRPNRSASVPPAPALMLRMQLFLSCGPLRKTFSSSASSSLKNCARSRSSSCFDLGLGGFRLGLAQLDHDPEIFELLLRLEQRLDLAAEGVGLVDELLGLLAVVPEVLRRHQGVRVRPGVSARPGRQRNLRKCVSFWVAVLMDAVTSSNIRPA